MWNFVDNRRMTVQIYNSKIPLVKRAKLICTPPKPQTSATSPSDEEKKFTFLKKNSS